MNEYFQWWLHLTLMSNAVCALGQSCLQPTDSRNKIPFRHDRFSAFIPGGTQSIFTSYQFHCCGHITEWQGYFHRPKYLVALFQVWRPPSSNEGGGCYTLVGQSALEQIEGNLGGSTLGEQDLISVQPGDVVGFFIGHLIPRNTDDFEEIGNIGLQLNSSLVSESVWYRNFAEQESGPSHTCQASVGPSGALREFTSAAPVIRVAVNSLPCPTFPPTSPPTTQDDSQTPTQDDSQTPSSTTTASITSEQPNLIIAGSIMAACMLAVLLTAGFLLAISITVQKKKNTSANRTMEVTENGTGTNCSTLSTNCSTLSTNCSTLSTNCSTLSTNCSTLSTDVGSISVNPAYGGRDGPSIYTDIPASPHLYSSVSSDHHPYTNITEHQQCLSDYVL